MQQRHCTAALPEQLIAFGGGFASLKVAIKSHSIEKWRQEHLVKEKVHSQLRCVICPPFCLFTCFATMQQPLVTSPRGPVVLRLHVNASYFSTTVRRVTPPTCVHLPPLPCKQALIFFRDCQSSGIIIF